MVMQPRPKKNRLAFVACLAALACASCGVASNADPDIPDAEKPRLGLMTSLPIYWNESMDFADQIDGDEEPHWVRSHLEQSYRLVPLDTLAGEGNGALGELKLLLLAQPRTLSAEENVALDDWVRGGGNVLLFADPLLTEQSRYPLGDPRRPQDVALLSPILERWGLEMTFDESQPHGARGAELGGRSIPINLAGSFNTISAEACDISADGLLADCAIGLGRVIAVADAALLEDVDDHGSPDAIGVFSEDDREAVLDTLLQRSFIQSAKTRENTGETSQMR